MGLRDHRIELLGIDNLRLFGLSVEDGVVQRFALVEDGEVFLGIQANRDSCMAQGIGRALGLDLVDYFAKLEGQVFRERACFLPGQDLVEIVLVCKRAMGIQVTARLDCKALVARRWWASLLRVRRVSARWSRPRRAKTKFTMSAFFSCVPVCH